MTVAKILLMPVEVAALVCCLAVTSLFAASGAIGWYYLWAYQHVQPYKSEHRRAAIIAGAQGALCALIVGESAYGFISLLSNRKGPIRWYLWLSWITFFLGCIATAGTALLIWVFHFGAHGCTRSSSGQVTCKDLQLALRVVLTVVAVLGCWIQSQMPTVLRLVYSRFAVQETLSTKQTPLRVDHEHSQEAPEMSTNPQADQLVKRPAVEV
ncbi:hypothetical protein BDM02DRAFT_3183420 [Thelephora ganbajun]|uniref:Uncharacterized protein n=1 Tax=Thelephora ganbajun TaxID=370292 RepID=A0ACB6ZTI3_THEGA|nr:hypothetical protein BDM02DRAFT_3183420 [Thelephora ganbajun]